MPTPFTYAFGTFVIHPLAEDHQPMVSAPGLAYGIRHVPYSNFNVLDLGGRTERRFKVGVRVAPADVDEWEALLGSTTTLEVAGVVWPSATLVDLGEHTMTPLGEWHLYAPEWVVG